MRPLFPLGLPLAALMLLALPATAGHVLVVGFGAGQLPEIQAAVDAAVDGDVILVKSGGYSSFLVTNKELSIVADVGQTATVHGAIRARGLSADRTLVIAGLRATGELSSNLVAADGAYLKNCAGFVRFQDCILTAISTGPCLPAAPRYGAEIEGCSAVSFVRCTLTGSPGQAGGAGVTATSSSVALHDCNLYGGIGVNYGSCGYDGGLGGAGATLTSSFLYGSDSFFGGGHGGDGHPWAGCGGDGGIGLLATGAGGTAHLLDTQYWGGGGGTACSLACCNGYTGSASNVRNGTTLDSISGTARRLSAASVARELTSLPLAIQGVAGDFVALRIGQRPLFAFDPTSSGVGLVAGPTPSRWLDLGTMTSASLAPTIPLPPIPASDPGHTYYLQALHVDASGRRWLGSPLSLVVLDSAY